MSVRRRFGLILATIALGAPGWAWAQTSGDVQCHLAATPLDFGRYSSTTGAPSDVTLTLTVTCAGTSGEAVAVEGSVALVGGAIDRRLEGGAGELRYQLYLDAARSRPWGDGVSGGLAAPVSGLVAPNASFRQTITIYGRILGRQRNATAGRYADRIDAVLQY